MIFVEEILTNKCCFYSVGFRSEVLPKARAHKNLENVDKASHEPIVKDHTLGGVCLCESLETYRRRQSVLSRAGECGRFGQWGRE